ncbi:MAG: hypothetical protein ACUVTD_04675 [Nitrososphaerales archaeon]
MIFVVYLNRNKLNKSVEEKILKKAKEKEKAKKRKRGPYRKSAPIPKPKQKEAS